MGLALSVGILADLEANDEEGAVFFRQAFERLNAHLTVLGLPAHVEPVSCESWGGEMHGYSGLHYLRRIAAHFDCSGTLPPPGGKSSSGDPTLEAYFAQAVESSPSLMGKLFGKRPRFNRSFDHLILHSDAEGFYLPLDFAEVIFPPQAAEIPGGMVGSAPRLLAELDRLASALGIPDTLTSTSDELWDAADFQGDGEGRWQRYGVESFTCVTLREGCRHALRVGAALVFC